MQVPVINYTETTVINDCPMRCAFKFQASSAVCFSQGEDSSLLFLHKNNTLSVGTCYCPFLPFPHLLWRGLEHEHSPVHQHKLCNQASLGMGFHLLLAHHTLALRALKRLDIYFFYQYNAEEIWIRTDTI